MSGGLSTEDLARTNPMRGFLTVVLSDEARLGRIQRDRDGVWRATDALVAQHGAAMSWLGPPRTNLSRKE
jgi:hypothetical protein